MRLIRSAIEAATVADLDIRKLILDHIAEIADDISFPDVHGYFVIVEAGDTLEAINAQVGFDVLSKPVEILEDCGSCWE